MLVTGVLASCASPPAIATPTPAVGESCTKQVATTLVDSFFASWNAGDAARVTGLFGPTFSFNDNVARERTTVSARPELQQYLTTRFALNDRFSSVLADIPEHPSSSGANPTASFVRTTTAATYRGNAKLVCEGNMLVGVVMSVD
jgi:hypothetical protein